MSTAVAMGRPLIQQAHGDLREQASDACGVRRQTMGNGFDPPAHLPLPGVLTAVRLHELCPPLYPRVDDGTDMLSVAYGGHVSYPLSTSLKVKAVLRTTISVVLTVTRYLLERHKVHPHSSWYLLLKERYSLFPALSVHDDIEYENVCVGN
ncbi:hypothetical protein M440DRAFT_1217284 [Trichoderma longibrachiatum ATCC 18648]|uniref:Uncharacterized protein n=1 Tax=Trichoderma longibrachiatum ATCC 18648 TaxID=983965 RepID=A0A2T4C7T8_TRILO|nr:hypothetical protein M440DRAFT_1217284 [Trichoderma longibrachiatum ATCC 18648]